MKPLGIFPKWSERINLAMPFVAAGALMVVLEPSKSIPNYNHWLELISGFLFLNAVHNVFSIIMICFLREFRAVVSEKTKEEGIFFLLKIAGVFVFSFSLSLFVYLYQSADLAKVVHFAFYMLNIHHALKQVYGISLMYNRHNQIDRQEKWLYRFFFLVNGIGITSMAFYGEDFDKPLFRGFWCVLTLIFASIIFGKAVQGAKNYPSNKSAFVARNFLRPLGFLFPPLMLVAQFTHGIEYLFTFNLIVARSKFQKTWRTAFLVLGGAMLLLLFQLAHHHVLFEPSLESIDPNKALVIHILTALPIAVPMTHFYLDRIFFKMSDPIVRKHIHPLLVQPVLAGRPSLLQESGRDLSVAQDRRVMASSVARKFCCALLDRARRRLAGI